MSLILQHPQNLRIPPASSVPSPHIFEPIILSLQIHPLAASNPQMSSVCPTASNVQSILQHPRIHLPPLQIPDVFSPIPSHLRTPHPVSSNSSSRRFKSPNVFGPSRQFKSSVPSSGILKSISRRFKSPDVLSPILMHLRIPAALNSSSRESLCLHLQSI